MTQFWLGSEMAERVEKLTGPLVATISALSLVATLFFIAPGLFLDPRFWAEEAVFYYPNALKLGPASLLSVINGNYQFLTNLLAWLSTLVDPLYAPAVTSYASIGIMCIVAAQIALVVKDVGAAPLLAPLVVVAWVLSPVTWEVTATATNIQWIAAISILLLAFQSLRGLRWPASAALLLWAVACGLTGVPSALLTPVLLLSGLAQKSRLHIAIGLVLGICALIQIGIIVQSGAPNRSPEFGIITTLLPPFTHDFYGQLLGLGEARILAEQGVKSRMSAAALIVFGTAALAALLALSERRLLVALALFAFALAGILQSIGAYGDAQAKIASVTPVHGARYYATGGTALLIAFAIFRTRPAIPAIVLAFVALNAAPQAAKHFAWEAATFRSWRAQVTDCEGVCRIEAWPPSWSVEIRRHR